MAESSESIVTNIKQLIEQRDSLGAAQYFEKNRNPHRKLISQITTECSICMDPNGLKMKCGHSLCTNCMLEFTWQQIKRGDYSVRCAICKKDITTEEIFKIGMPEDIEKNAIEVFFKLNKEESEQDNSKMKEQLNMFLSSVPTKEMTDLGNNTTTIPSMRACPTCSSLLQHVDGCNKMTCGYCMANFCFICLRLNINEQDRCLSTQKEFICIPAPIQKL